jgi:uncharacterized protein (TIGR02757 family)
MDSKTIKLKNILDREYERNNVPSFIETDPIQIPHLFTNREDIEISAFLTAQIAWGKRSMIIKNALSLMHRMDMSPFDFVMNAGKAELTKIEGFVHRTFNAEDCKTEILALRKICQQHSTLKDFFESTFRQERSIYTTLSSFRMEILKQEHQPRFTRHISDVTKKSAAKRLNLFLMWMCRRDNRGVHFGLWDIPSSELLIPLDIHCGNAARKLGLLSRKQNDWPAVKELTDALRQFDPNDPVKYDFALFGMGVQGLLNNGILPKL